MSEALFHRVGIFDSGIGGLTVLRECVRVAPENVYFYLGDNFRAPYGSRSEAEITGYVREALETFSSLGADAVVLACNTATAVCAEQMRREFSFPVVGIEPAVKSASGRFRRVLVLATPRTAESSRLRRLIERYPDDYTVFSAPHLAKAVEDYAILNKPVRLSEHLPRGAYDCVVLGCTHYVYLRKEISRFYGAPAIDGNAGTAKRLVSVLREGETNGRFPPGLTKFGTNDHFCPAHPDGENSASNVNRCSQNFTKKGVFFLGLTQNINKSVYERMFVSS